MRERISYKTIKEPVVYEQSIKKSKFFGRLFPVESMEAAQVQIDACKKEFWDASHNCSAMVIGIRGEYTRCSDDGEPQGTAGVPMLEALKKSEITNVLAVVTRYFGGTLLGTGGLVRAYTSSISEAIKAAQQILHRPVTEYEIILPFPLFGKAQAQLIGAGYLIEEITYAEHVTLQVFAEQGKEAGLFALLSELSAGSVVPKEVRATYLSIEL